VANIKNNVVSQETRRKLIEVAGQVFAEHGLSGATAKQITDRAKVNVAAINYHFKDKTDLYIEVLRQACVAAAERLLSQPLTGDPETRLRVFILRMVQDSERQPRWQMKLYLRELTDPTAALDWVADLVARPLTTQLVEIVKELAGPGMSQKEAIFIACGIIAQCLFFTRDRSLMQRLYPDLDVMHDPKKLAERIADFALGAIRGKKAKPDKASLRVSASSRSRTT
jgi:TetR/AcrR family transcriptional regulator, regulator of cefoperazone and chloramphenicol sensitivity